MLRIAITMLAIAAASPAHADKLPTLVGRWKVVGCETSPKDPAPCAKGTIVFDAAKWSIDIGCCKRKSAYKVLSSTKDRIKISSDGEETVIVFDADGAAHWRPGGLGGRVGELLFERTK